MADTKEYIKGDKNVFQAGSTQIKFVQMNFPSNKGEWEQEKKDLEKEFEYADFEEVESDHWKAKPETNEQPNFVNRLKTIIKKASEKNGQRIETNIRGHVGSYTYMIDADCFCKAIDDLEEYHSEKLLAFLGGSIENVEITKVGKFIGSVVRLCVVNDKSLLIKDIVFAFKDFYDNDSTIISKLSDKKLSPDESVLFGTFEGLLKKHKTQNNRQ